jgi:hypothetical protein
MRVFILVITAVMLSSGSAAVQAAPERPRGVETSTAAAAADFSAAKKKRKKQARPVNADDQFLATRSMTHQAERAQIACPRAGCQPVPRGCLREPERTFSGEPTGFDRIVCPMR